MPAASASSTSGGGTGSPAATRTPPAATMADQSAVNSVTIAATSRVSSVVRSGGGEQVLDEAQEVEPRIGEAFDSAPRLDRHTVDLLDLAREQVDEIGTQQGDRELVDRDALALLEHVDADDVGAERTNARCDGAQRAGPIGEPDPDEEPGEGLAAGPVGNGAVSHERSVGCDHPARVRRACGHEIAAV